ncbi:hypothetical protein [Chlorogloeopsis sp. ULAP02]|uniref:hypothetical protein n=1 Tax=Chlorogloeopsis sp. ULAP02 TaxID=3107926 RepID=UPI0031356E17
MTPLDASRYNALNPQGRLRSFMPGNPYFRLSAPRLLPSASSIAAFNLIVLSLPL